LASTMTDTRAYHEAEAWVRDHGLPRLFEGRRFKKLELEIGVKRDGSPAFHEFDAVSEDGRVVASVSCAAGRTSGDRAPTGQSRYAYKEVYFLSRTKASKKILVLADELLFSVFTKESDGKLPEGVGLMHVRVPDRIWNRVLAARTRARAEVTPSRHGPAPSDTA
jgi:hypothetical protein